tara:strand:- start:406 stop:543 length:138 start_codon:yes stop_codon:yes gene_type:complete
MSLEKQIKKNTKTLIFSKIAKSIFRGFSDVLSDYAPSKVSDYQKN